MSSKSTQRFFQQNCHPYDLQGSFIWKLKLSYYVQKALYIMRTNQSGGGLDNKQQIFKKKIFEKV